MWGAEAKSEIRIISTIFIIVIIILSPLMLITAPLMVPFVLLFDYLLPRIKMTGYVSPPGPPKEKNIKIRKISDRC